MKKYWLLVNFLFASIFLFGQESSIDTSNCLIKFCTSNNKFVGMNIDIIAHVCVYKKNGDTAQNFSVKSFDLVYKNEQGEKMVFTNHNPFFSFESKAALMKIKAKEDASNYYFTNVKIEDIKTKHTALIKRLTPLLEAFDLELK